MDGYDALEIMYAEEYSDSEEDGRDIQKKFNNLTL